MQNHNLAKIIADVSHQVFERASTYKVDRHGTNAIDIEISNQSSRIYKRCVGIKLDPNLLDRINRYDVCDPTIDRDLKASRIIKRIGLIKVECLRSIIQVCGYRCFPVRNISV